MTSVKLLVLALTIFSVACKKESTPPDPSVIFKATLNGQSESTPNASTATGSATLTYNPTTKIFNVTVTYTGIVATGAHIHKGAVGVAGPIIFPFTTLASPINYTSPPLDAAQEADLMAGLYYANVHSDAFKAGEIRGQLLKQ